MFALRPPGGCGQGLFIPDLKRHREPSFVEKRHRILISRTRLCQKCTDSVRRWETKEGRMRKNVRKGEYEKRREKTRENLK